MIHQVFSKKCLNEGSHSSQDGKVFDLASRRKKFEKTEENPVVDAGGKERTPRSTKPTSVYRMEEARNRKAYEDGRGRSGLGTSLHRRANRNGPPKQSSNVKMWVARAFQVAVLIVVAVLVIGNCTGKKFL